MKVCLDGFALSLKKGTGLSTYSRELAKTLASGGIDVSVLYGMDRLGRRADLKWSRFIQRLMVHGEADSKEVLRYGKDAVRYSIPYLLNIPFRPRQLHPLDWVEGRGLDMHLPQGSEIYNLSSLYRVSQSYAFFLPRSLSVAMPRKSGIDLFHSTSPLPVRMKGMPNVLTLHDLIPLILPHSTNVMLRHYRNIITSSLRQADQILVISEHSKRDLQRVFGIEDDKIQVTYQSVQVPTAIRDMSPGELRSVLSKNFNLKPQGYFLFFGAIEPKKNVMRILEAAGMANTDLPLIIAGRDGWLYKKEKRRIKQVKQDGSQSVRRYMYLPRQQLMYLLRGAKALIFPSLYEGFGLPVLEAMSMGVPVITSDCTSLPEVGGDAPLYVDPYDVSSIAGAMERLAGDDTLCCEAARKGLEQASTFSTERHLALLQQGYQKAMDAYYGHGAAYAKQLHFK